MLYIGQSHGKTKLLEGFCKRDKVTFIPLLLSVINSHVFKICFELQSYREKLNDMAKKYSKDKPKLVEAIKISKVNFYLHCIISFFNFFFILHRCTCLVHYSCIWAFHFYVFQIKYFFNFIYSLIFICVEDGWTNTSFKEDRQRC